MKVFFHHNVWLVRHQHPDSIDAAKGLLILLIVLGHNHYFMQDRSAYLALYSFHIAAFFFLSALLVKARPIDQAFVRDRLVRYLVPFAAFTLLYAVAYTLFFSSHTGFFEFLLRTSAAMTIASSRLLDEATGLKMLWFLPALFTFVMGFTWLLNNVTRLRQRGLPLYIGLILAHGLVGLLPVVVKTYIPWGILIVLYLLPLAVMVRFAYGRYPQLFSIPAGIAAVVAWGLLAFYADLLEGYTTLADMDVYGWNDLPMLAIYDLLAICGFIAVIACAPLYLHMPGIVAIGRASLMIYLIHPLAFQLVKLPFTAMGVEGGVIAIVSSYLLTLAITLAAVRLLQRWILLREALFPRDYAQWKRALQALYAWKARKASSSSE